MTFKLFNNLFCSIAFSFSLLILPHLGCSAPQKYKSNVNILTWWGYLDTSNKQIEKIEDICHTNISYDDYYSNEAFITQYNAPNANYDIAIFSRTISDDVLKKTNNPSSKLYLLAKKYNPIIKKHYNQDHYPHNIVYFTHSLTGFIYNPKVLNIKKNISIYKIFHRAGNKIVVMIDDPIEANFLISLLMNRNTPLSMKRAKSISLSWENFKNLIQNTHVIITNSPQHILKLPSFALAFQWSGEAIQYIKNSHGQLKFFVHPTLSYISSDLLAGLNSKRTTECVANQLASQWFLNGLQNRVDYFSPYMNDKKISDPYFKIIYIATLKNLDTLPWVVSVSMKNFKKINNSWELIKYNLDKTQENPS